MTTRRTRALVSLAAATSLTLALGACVRGAARPALNESALMEEQPLTIRFENGAREHVHVYLVGERREWLLGRVETGARTTLKLPPALRAGDGELVRLAVIAGDRLTLQAARHPRAVIAVTLTPAEIVSQRWMLTQGQLASVPLSRGWAEAGDPR